MSTGEIEARCLNGLKGTIWDYVPKMDWQWGLSGRFPETEIGLVQSAVESSRIGINDSKDMIMVSMETLASAVSYSLLRKSVRDYTDIVGHKIVAGVADSPDSFKATMPTQKFSESVSNGGRILDPLEIGRARRWRIEEGEWVEIPPFNHISSDDKLHLRINPEYLDAEVEDTVVFSPDVFSIAIPAPTGLPDYPLHLRGVEIQWKNRTETDESSPYYNPDGAWGWYRAKMQNAAIPSNIFAGAVIRHLR